METEKRDKRLVLYVTPAVEDEVKRQAKACGFRFTSGYLSAMIEGLASQDFVPYGFAKVGMKLNKRKEDNGIPMSIQLPFTAQPVPKLPPNELTEKELQSFIRELQVRKKRIREEKKLSRITKTQTKESYV